MTTNNRKHRLKLFPSAKSDITIEEAIARTERAIERYHLIRRVGGHLRDEKLDKILWRRNKRRKEQRHCAEKRVKGNG